MMATGAERLIQTVQVAARKRKLFVDFSALSETE